MIKDKNGNLLTDSKVVFDKWFEPTQVLEEEVKEAMNSIKRRNHQM